MYSLVRDLRPLFPVVQTLFFQHVSYTKNEEPLFTSQLNMSSGYPTTYSLSSYYVLRPDFSFRKGGFQTAVNEFEGIERSSLRRYSDEEARLVNRILQHWKEYDDSEASSYSHIVLEKNKFPKLIVANADLPSSLENRCKVIHLENVQTILDAEQRREEDRERMKNRILVFGLLGVFLGLSRVS